MNPSEAAIIIGIDVSQVRRLCRSKKLRAEIEPIDGGYKYNIEPSSVREYATRKQSRGFPRGKSRTKLRGKKQ